LGLLLHDAARLLKSEFERRARGHRLTLMQWRVLGQLSRSDGLTQTALGALVEASPMTVSDILDRLERMDLVRREADPGDSRAKLVWITAAARPLIDEMRAVAVEVYDSALANISAEDREALMRSLGQIVDNLGGHGAVAKEAVE
jgi:DNA-binding MarR family transcriptional regulator